MPRLSALSNPTGLVDVDRKRVSIFVEENGKHPSFSLAHLDLAGLQLPASLNVVVIASRGNSEDRVELGLTPNWDKSFRSLPEIASEGPWNFRVLLVQKGSPKLLAAAENVRPQGEGDGESFIALEPADLGQIPWGLTILEAEGRVVISFNKAVYQSSGEAAADRFFTSLVLPEAIRRLAEWVSINPAVLDEQTWEPLRNWLALHGITDGPESESQESQLEWCSDVIAAFCNRFEFAEQLKEARTKGVEE